MFDTLFNFIKLTHAFSGVERDLRIHDLSRKENDTEHSYQLAMIAWYIANKDNLSLNREKIIKYALVHDLAEVYAGDTAPFTDDPEYNKQITSTKIAREEAAFKKLTSEFPEFSEMIDTITVYEQKADLESRFVYIIDKIVADLNCYLSGERYYVDRKYPYSEWIEWFNGKFKKLGATSNIEQQLLDEYYAFMKEHKDYFFAETR